MVPYHCLSSFCLKSSQHTVLCLVKISHLKFCYAVVNNKRKASVAVAPGSGDQSSTNSDLQPPAPQKKSCLTPTISVTYCQPQVTSLPSFAFSSLPQPDTSKLLANLEQKAKAESCMQSMGSSNSPGNAGPGSVSSTSTTSEAASATPNQNSNSSR